MSDDLRRTLRALPADEPGPRFTAEVLARLDEAAAPQSHARPLRRWAAVAAGLTLIAGAWGVHAGREVRRKAELRRESAALAADLAALRAQAAQPAPLLYLGGTEEVDLVLDLSSLPLTAAVRVTGSRDGVLD
jgi:hypothetical protein